MNTGIRKALAGLAVGVVVTFGALPGASADGGDNTVTHVYSRAEVKQWVKDNKGIDEIVCGTFPKALPKIFQSPAKWACKQDAKHANAGQKGVFREAASENCGVKMVATANGGGNSWDRADFKYTQTGCA